MSPAAKSILEAIEEKEALEALVDHLNEDIRRLTERLAQEHHQ